VKNSLRLQYPYESINLFHSEVGNIITENLDNIDMISIVSELKKMEEIAFTWIQNNLDEYNDITSSEKQNLVIQKIFPTKDINHIYTRWQYCILNLMYYNNNINNEINKEAGYFISKRETAFTIHTLVQEQVDACFKCAKCKQTIDKESITNIHQCDKCCQRYCSLECKQADILKIHHSCELRRK
jgi:hypothetical protein